MQNRFGDQGQICFRPDRYSYICGCWYVSTREQGQIGPFETRQEAELELLLYLLSVTGRNYFRLDNAEFWDILREC